MGVTRLIKYVAFGDLHYGFDKVITSRGRLRSKPVHDLRALNMVFDFIEDFKPDKIMLMGDQFDMRPVSRHELGIAKKQEGQRLQEAYERGYEEFIVPLVHVHGDADIDWVDGNHEAWAYKLTNQFPGLDGCIDPYNYLRLNTLGWTHHPPGSVLKLGKLAFAHGDTLVQGASKYAAARAVERYGSSIRIWHFHTLQVSPKPTLKNGAYQTGKVIPCLCTRSPHYDPSPVNSVVLGFNYGFIEDDGSFHDFEPVIFKYRFRTGEGKLYVG